MPTDSHTLAEREKQLIARYALIENLHERLAAVVDRGRKLAPLAAEEKTEARRVPGCVSRVWLVGSVEEGRCRFRVDADSALVKGLAGLLCAVYEGATVAEVAGCETRVLEALRLAENLSPTRQHGLAQVRRAIQAVAQ